MASKAARPTAAFPPVILIDQREKAAYTFANIHADKTAGGGLIQVQTRVEYLKTGDYTLPGYEHRVAVEKKSLPDLFGTLGQGRDRFTRELARLNGMQFAAVVVEAEWSEVLGSPPPHTQLSPKTVYRSVLAWQQRFKNVHWLMMPGRAAAEVTTFRVLERFWKERQREAAEGMVSVAVTGGELVVSDGDEPEHEGSEP